MAIMMLRTIAVRLPSVSATVTLVSVLPTGKVIDVEAHLPPCRSGRHNKALVREGRAAVASAAPALPNFRQIAHLHVIEDAIDAIRFQDFDRRRRQRDGRAIGAHP